ncbi:MAG: transcriptional regulator BetI [Rhodobacteraceae bacterium]|nr:transcriptional regulator BetI [Paracoccaceae bacterium]
MPKIGMEPLRRDALIKAAIAEIGRVGSLDVTVSQIARRVGVSSALAHHYMGGKTQIFLAAMRHILSKYGAEVRRELATAKPDERAEAIIRASYSAASFEPEAIGAWMTFYVLAQTEPEALRLWRVYQCRARSNLTHALRPVCARPVSAADTLVVLTDGLYIRAALNDPDTPQLPLDHTLRVLKMLKDMPE